MSDGLVTSKTNSRLEITIAALCAGFIVVLLVSGYFERDVLVLHLFQSLIYVAVAALSFRHSKFGYGMGISIAAFWNGYNLFLSGFIGAGFRQWAGLLRTGRVTNPAHLVAAPAGIIHFALIACLIWAYGRLPNKRVRDVLILLASFVVVMAYFMAIIAVFWPQFLPRMKARLLG